MITDEYYGTLADADLYAESRGNDAWDGDNDAKTAALIRGSAYIDGRYRSRFPGEKTGGRAQYLQWPRTGALDADGNEIDSLEIPFEIIQATFESAARELATPGSLSPDYIASAQVKREKVGEIEVEYSGSAQSGTLANAPVISLIDGILSGLLTSNRSVPAVFVV